MKRFTYSLLPFLIVLLIAGCSEKPTELTDSLIRIYWQTDSSGDMCQTRVTVIAWEPEEGAPIGIDYRVVHLNSENQLKEIREGTETIDWKGWYLTWPMMLTFSHQDSCGPTFEYRFTLIAIADEKEIETKSGTYKPCP